jgi:hypothetical protein
LFVVVWLFGVIMAKTKRGAAMFTPERLLD